MTHRRDVTEKWRSGNTNGFALIEVCSSVVLHNSDTKVRLAYHLTDMVTLSGTG